MKKHMLLLLPLCLLWLNTLLCNVTPVFAESALSYTAVPPFVADGAPPLVMLAMGRDHKLYYEAYNDASDLNDDGVLDIRYTPAIDYYGYFDSYKCYTYNSANSRFDPSSTTTNKKCTNATGRWSGDFLNYITMSRMDTLRKVLYGGYRSTDTATETILQRVYVPQDAHSWGKEYKDIATDKYDIRDYTPLALPNANTYHLFASTTLSDNGNPLLRVLPNNTHRIWDWVAKERPVADNSLETTGGNYYTSQPSDHTAFNNMVSEFANAAHLQGTGAPANGRIDGSGNPYGLNDYYLNIFTGQIMVATAGTYQFAVDGDDAVEVIIDGVVVASWYNGHGRCFCQSHSGSIYLTSGSHTVEFRHQETEGEDNYFLYWKGADNGNVWDIVPAIKFNNLVQTTYDVKYASSKITDYQVRVKVCDSSVGLETNCQQYPSGNYKPVGLLQRHGESLYDSATSTYRTPKMYFGLMTGSYTKNTSGGVLRKKMGNISDEIETNTTGQFKTSVNGIIQTINKFRIYGYNYGDYSYNLNCGWITSGPMSEGQCRNWGNPIGEIMYESLRYIAGKGAATSAYDYSGATDDSTLGLPKATWNDPYDKTNGGFDSCSQPFMLVISDINPSYDSDQLPGVNTNFNTGFSSSLTASNVSTKVSETLNVSTEAAAISAIENVGSNIFIGQSRSTNDNICSAKNVLGLDSIRGLCPEEPTKMGSYYSASVAKYGHTHDLNPVEGVQKVTTYGIGLASPLPRIEFKIGPDEKLITLVPLGKSVGGMGITSAFYPTNGIVNLFVETLTPTFGRFRINFEDMEQGADHDMDAIVMYEYQLLKADDTNAATAHEAAKVKITLNSIYAAGGIIQHLGYIISGTTADKAYLEVRDLDTDAASDVHAAFDTGGTPLPLTATRTFTPSGSNTATAAQLLPNPLWYAAKWGAYEEKDDIDGPNLKEEWDKDNDGIPDTYFYVTNPLKLEEQLSKSFADILRRTMSGSAASVISGSRSGEGAVYQSVFYPELSDGSAADNKVAWVGDVHASFVDSQGRMREDTMVNGIQNHILDKNDKVIKYRKDSTNKLWVDKYSLADSVAEVTSVTLPAASATLAGKYFRLNTVDEKFYIWFTVDGSGNDPRPTNMVGISVALGATDTANDVATKTAATLAHYTQIFTVPTPAANIITITNVTPGESTDASPGTSGFSIVVSTQGIGEKETFASSGTPEQINYLWAASSWLNSITDTSPDYNIITQRDYNDVTKDRRYIFTFIDANQNKIAESGEQVPFVAGASLPTAADLVNSATIFPYIPVNADSKALPAYATNIKTEFLQNQVTRVINYIRGEDQGAKNITYTDPNTHVNTVYKIPAFRSRKLDLDHDGTLEATWRLGDIVYSSPSVVNKPQESFHLIYKDASYGTFASQYSQRRTVVYAGANDGMFHAFNGGFYEDRFDVYPSGAPDGVKDIEYLLQPKDKDGKVITSGYAPHALGAELWAYVPYNLLPHLYWLTDPDYQHVYYADLKPRIFDAKIFPEDTDHPGGWGTVLVGGMRFGGGKIDVDMNKLDGNVTSSDRTMTSAYFVLDITNPEVPPKVLGEINFPQLGYTTCYPTVVTMKDKPETASSPNRWFLVFGSGPAEADGIPGRNTKLPAPQEYSLANAVSKQKAKVYVVDLVEMAKSPSTRSLQTLDTTGHLVKIVPPVAPAKPMAGYYQSFDSDNDAFISDPITVDFDLDYKADAVYFGTESYNSVNVGSEWGGKLRRIVMDNNADPAYWTGDSTLINLETSSVHQPITASPTVGVDPDGNDWVFFGTGRYYIRTDKDIIAQQTFYGIKEPKKTLTGVTDENSYAEVTRNTLYDSTLIEVNAASEKVSGGPVPPSGTVGSPIAWKDFVTATKSFKGWYYNFTDNLERSVGQAALFGDLTIFTSYIPSNDICTYEGSSYLYALYYLTGTAPSSTVLYDLLFPTPTNNIKRTSLGTGLVSKPSIHVGSKDGATAFVQSSDGSIIPVDVETPGTVKSGRAAWSQRE